MREGIFENLIVFLNLKIKVVLFLLVSIIW